MDTNSEPKEAEAHKAFTVRSMNKSCRTFNSYLY